MSPWVVGADVPEMTFEIAAGEGASAVVHVAYVDDDFGAFFFGNIFGDRIFKVGLAKGWRVVSIRADGKDVTDDVLYVAPGSRTQLTITVGRQ